MRESRTAVLVLRLAAKRRGLGGRPPQVYRMQAIIAGCGKFGHRALRQVAALAPPDTILGLDEYGADAQQSSNSFRADWLRTIA
jgi:hypothetical protein